MEGTHTILHLHKPIKEVCYVSFYRPRGKVRGFMYLGSASLDKSIKYFVNLFQIQEGTRIAELGGRACLSLTTLFKQTATQDILSVLYNWTANKELLTDLFTLHSNFPLGIQMGNQDGKLQEQAENSEKAEVNPGFKNLQRSLSTDGKKSVPKTKKIRKSSKRRESLEEFMHNKFRRKLSGSWETSSALITKGLSLGRDKAASAKLSISTSPSTKLTSSFVNALQQSDVNSNKLQPDDVTVAEIQSKGKEFLQRFTSQESDSDLGSCLSEYDNDVFTECRASPCNSLFNELVDGFQAIPGQTGWLAPNNSSSSDTYKRCEVFSELERNKDESLQVRLHEDVIKQNVAKTVVRMKELDNLLQKTVSTCTTYDINENTSHAEDKKTVKDIVTVSNGYLTNADKKVLQASNVQCTKERETSIMEAQTINESCKPSGFVNKNLLKVIQSDSFDETADWKRLHKGKEDAIAAVSEKSSLQPEKNKHSLLNLPSHNIHDYFQDNGMLKSDVRDLTSSLLATASNLCPVSNTQQHIPPLPSPLASCLPSPQKHHRILPLPTKEEPGVNEWQSESSSPTHICEEECNDLLLCPCFKLSDAEEGTFTTKSVDLNQAASPEYQEEDIKLDIALYQQPFQVTYILVKPTLCNLCDLDEMTLHVMLSDSNLATKMLN
ncbi:formin-1-like [Protopterus annectens]|uniref:formin-1-like n=1 Tax=Protopterus annectens TaxID=7888 RepID=UPI001CFBC650|nr:formin-1-like [Protopterus annectens]